MSQEPEPSIIEYARFYGLAKNHLEPHPLCDISIERDLWQPSEGVPGLIPDDFENVEVPAERIFIDEETASLLATLAFPLSKETPRFDEDTDIDTHRARDLKQELPFLRTDHDSDLRCFSRRIGPDLENEFLPSESVDEEADEGLHWPTRYYKLAHEMWSQIQSEKLAVSSDAFLFLQDSLKCPLENDEHLSFEDNDAEPIYERTHALGPMLSPIFPLSPGMLLDVPDSEVGHLESLPAITSPEDGKSWEPDAIPPTQRIAVDSDHKSQLADKAILGSASLNDTFSPLEGVKDPPSSPPPSNSRIQDLKVEEPSSPREPEQRSLWENKHVPLSEALPDHMPNLPVLFSASASHVERDIDTFFEQSIAPVTIKMEQDIEQEQLREANTMLRVDVPIVDFSRPKAPWDQDPPQSGMVLSEELSSLQIDEYYWPTNGKAEAELQWAPFPAALAKIVEQDEIEDDGSTAAYIEQPQCIDYDSLLWKPEGLRILDELADSEEEELEEGTFLDDKNFGSLLRKRKLEMDDDAEDLTNALRKANSCPVTVEPDFASTPRPLGKANFSMDARTTCMDMNSLKLSVGTDFSALDALSTFIAVRKGVLKTSKKDIPLPSSKSRQADQISDNLPLSQLHEAIKPAIESVSQIDVTLTRRFISSKESYQYVVSTAFLSNRKLARQVLTLYPSAQLVERDWTIHEITPILSNEPPTTTQIDSIANEADLILSPGVGLTWTTLQKTKQRSLPGQVSHSALRDRIMCAAPRYECLIVLISQGLLKQDASQVEVDQSDCDALIKFKSFCASLPAKVEVTFVQGGEDELVKWIVAMMIKHGMDAHQVLTTQEESLEELFLRKAGLNSFAAQVVVSSLEDLSDSPNAMPKAGLATFVRMSLGAKLARFERLFGGKRLLTRIHQVLECHW